jgi:hypothetical protein
VYIKPYAEAKRANTFPQVRGGTGTPACATQNYGRNGPRSSVRTLCFGDLATMVEHTALLVASRDPTTSTRAAPAGYSSDSAHRRAPIRNTSSLCTHAAAASIHRRAACCERCRWRRLGADRAALRPLGNSRVRAECRSAIGRKREAHESRLHDFAGAVRAK